MEVDAKRLCMKVEVSAASVFGWTVLASYWQKSAGRHGGDAALGLALRSAVDDFVGDLLLIAPATLSAAAQWTRATL